jgi:hypothetical protein
MLRPSTSLYCARFIGLMVLLRASCGERCTLQVKGLCRGGGGGGEQRGVRGVDEGIKRGASEKSLASIGI